METEGQLLTITRLGAQGDGVAWTADKPCFVPFALPGEQVRLRPQDQPELVSASSPDRTASVCRHFGVCGGCVAQHMSERLYRVWKRDIVVDTLQQRGIDANVECLTPVPPASRRRAVFTARRQGRDVTLGYHRRRSNAIFDLVECPVLFPAIVQALPALKAIAAAIETGECRMVVLATPMGLDIAVDTMRALTGRAGARLVSIAGERRLARLTVNGETLVEPSKPALEIGGLPVLPPPGAFVQAVARAEQALGAVVLTATEKAKRIADLFAGIGTFSLRLARRSHVLAIDSSKPALAALQEAARRASGLKPIETRVRDLFRDPLSPRELSSFDAVVFDPPRAGAKAQAEALAASKVATVVAVSCNPATLARDVRSLLDGGYRVVTVTPVDQFVYAAHVEVVAVLRRGR